jgi:branched-chain amino acid transport system substrate-binding protein
MKRFVITLWAAGSLLCSVLAQTSTRSAEKQQFDQGVTAYRIKNYSQARTVFESLLNDYPQGELTTAALLMLSKSYCRAEYPKKAVACADALMQNFPSSRYADEARLSRAEAEYILGAYRNCVEDLLQLVDQGHDRAVAHIADSLLNGVSRASLSPQELAPIISDLPESESKLRLTVLYFEKLIEDKRYHLAAKAITSFVNSRTSNAQTQNARDLLKRIRGKEEGAVKVGLIVPLNGPNSEIGKAVQSGVELAISLFNRSSKPKIELVTYDNQSEIISSIAAAQALSDDDQISVILGPMESDNMAAASVVANARRIPIISPTATKSGLTSIGPYVYQANVDIETRSEALARYAVKNLGLKRFAILSPSDMYGEIASNTFSKTVENLGGEMIAFEKFYENTQDFKSQITRIRKLGMINLATQMKLAQSSKLSAPEIDSVYSVYFPPDSTGQDEYSTPMNHIDALFLPLYAEDIKYIAPQLAFYNIKTQLLGGDNWYDLTELKVQQNYVKDIIFVSESYVDTNRQSTKTFFDQFRKLYGKAPAREAIYGFDVMEMIANIVKSGFYSSEEIQAELAKGLEWNGIHSKIIFSGTSRVNHAVQLLKFTNGGIVKLSE